MTNYKHIEVKCPDCQMKYQMRQDEYDLMVADKERVDRGKDSDWLSLKCPKNNDHYMMKLRKDIEAVPIEKRQEILDTFRKGGITIGEVSEKFKIDSNIVGHIITDNIKAYHYLGEKAI